MNRKVEVIKGGKRLDDLAEQTDLIVAEAVKHLIYSRGVAPISALGMLHQGTLRAMMHFGGDAALEFAEAVRVQFGSDTLNEAAEDQQHQSFKKMAEHCELLSAKPGGHA